MRDNDLETELQFHIDMRAESHVNAGMTPDDAEALARRQFGDVEAAMKGMRQARVRSTKTALIAVTSSAVVLAALWLYRGSPGGGPIVYPQPSAVSPQTKTQKRPPPPPPGPTWEEFVAKVNTFGDGNVAKSRRR